MNFGNSAVPLFAGLIVVVAGYWIATHYFSAEARIERRRRRSNARIASTVKRPMVRFNVRTKKKRRK